MIRMCRYVDVRFYLLFILILRNYSSISLYYLFSILEQFFIMSLKTLKTNILTFVEGLYSARPHSTSLIRNELIKINRKILHFDAN